MSCLLESIAQGNRKAKDVGTMHFPILARHCERSAQCSSSLLVSLEGSEGQLGSALREAEAHGGYLKWLCHHRLKSCNEAWHGLPGLARTHSSNSLFASIRTHTFSL